MRYKKYGSTDMNVSAITVGTWAIGGERWGEINDKSSIEAIREMVNNGVNFIDTAPAYNRGHAEEVVGQAIKAFNRKDLYISTKFGLPIGDGHGGYKRENVLLECDDSLRRLGTDYIDLYMFHWPDRRDHTPVEESMSALLELQKAGKIRYIGCSNFSKEQLIEARQFGDVVSIQPEFSMLSRAAQPLMQWCKENGVGTMTYGSLGSGLLTGAIREMPNFAPDDARARFYGKYYEPETFAKIQDLLKVLDEIAANHGGSVAQVTVNWQTQNDLVGTALMGVRNKEEAKENCDGTLWSLSADEIAAIDKALDTFNIQGRDRF